MCPIDMTGMPPGLREREGETAQSLVSERELTLELLEVDIGQEDEVVEEAEV